MASITLKAFAAVLLVLIEIACYPTPVGLAEDASSKRNIVLVAGETAKVDKLGHHDYLAGCICLEIL